MIELLPVELVLIILRGSAIADILNFTRTSSYFHRISLTNRSVWCDASDSYKLRLPLGETLKTTAVFDLPRNAARSASIAHKWQLHRLGEPFFNPIRTYEATRLYELPSWAFWSPLKYSKPSCLGHAPPTFINILPGGHAFLFGSMAHLGIYDLHGEYEYALEVPCSTQFDPRPGQGDSTVDWHSVDNGAHITVVVLSKAFNDRHDVESYLSVFDVDYVQGNAPSIRRTHILTLPIHATAISIKGSLILINSRDAFLIVNLKTKQRAVWHLSDMDSEITSAGIHPAEESVFLAVRSLADATRGLHIVDIPSVATEPFEGAPFWPCYSLTPSNVQPLPRVAAVSPAPPPLASFEFLPYPDPDGATGTFREVTLADPYTVVVSSTPVLRTVGGSQSQLVAAHHFGASPSLVLRSAHQRQILAAPGHGMRTLAVHVMCDSDRVLKLALLTELESVTGVGRTRTLAFDDIYGTMLVFARGRLFVVQY